MFFHEKLECILWGLAWAAPVLSSAKNEFTCILAYIFPLHNFPCISLCSPTFFLLIDCRSIDGTVFRRCKLLHCGFMCSRMHRSRIRECSELECLQKQFQCSSKPFNRKLLLFTVVQMFNSILLLVPMQSLARSLWFRSSSRRLHKFSAQIIVLTVELLCFQLVLRLFEGR